MNKLINQSITQASKQPPTNKGISDEQTNQNQSKSSKSKTKQN
jgi:hypothetical protein